MSAIFEILLVLFMANIFGEAFERVGVQVFLERSLQESPLGY